MNRRVCGNPKIPSNFNWSPLGWSIAVSVVVEYGVVVGAGDVPVFWSGVVRRNGIGRIGLVWGIGLVGRGCVVGFN